MFCEFCGALTGQALGLNIPDVAIVEVDVRLMEVVGPQDENIRIEHWRTGPHFGSRYLGEGASVMQSGYRFSENSLTQAINIFAFDMFVQNTDRKTTGVAGRPNLLFRDDMLFPIDHDMAFSFVNLIGDPQPWDLRGQPLATEHLFYLPLRQHAATHPLEFDEFIQALTHLPQDHMDAVKQRMPNAWYNDRYFEKISAHISLIQSDLDRFQQSLKAVFA